MFSVFLNNSGNKAAYFFIKYISKGKNVLLTLLNHTRPLFYQKTFYQSKTQRILILLLLFLFDIKTIIFGYVQSVCFLQFSQ